MSLGTVQDRLLTPAGRSQNGIEWPGVTPGSLPIWHANGTAAPDRGPSDLDFQGPAASGARRVAVAQRGIPEPPGSRGRGAPAAGDHLQVVGPEALPAGGRSRPSDQLAVHYDDVMLLAAPDWQQLSTWADLLSIAGMPLAIFGIWQAWRQAWRARSAAEAAGRAIAATEAKLRGRFLLALLVPQLHWIANELDFALQADDAEHAQRQLKTWRQVAGHARGMLNIPDEDTDKEQLELMALLQESVSLARIAGQTIAKSVDGPLLKSCMKARASISQVCDEFSMWVGETVTRTGDEG